MTVQLSQLAVQRFVDNNGNALAGGQLYTYQAGTSTLQPTYTDSTGLTANTNPIVLNARGEANIWVTSGQAYKFALYDSLSNLIWTVDNIIDAGAALAANLASTTNATLGSALVGWFQSLANFVGRTLSAKLSDQYSICDYGAVGDGVTDNATFLANCPATDLLVPPGTYLVNSNTTIAANLRFAAGAILKPASGVTITLSASFSALPVHIFDISAGGTITLPQQMTDFCAEWWGANITRTDNDVPINAAMAAVGNVTGTVASGNVTLERGNYKISNTINLVNNVWMLGKGAIYTVIRANTGWTAATPMILAKNGTASMFNCGIKKMRISGEDIANVCIYAPAWQQKSGTEDVLIERFLGYGIQLDTGYGGATQLTLRQTEIFVSAYSNTAYCIGASYTNYTVGYFTLNLFEVQTGCDFAQGTFTSAPLSGATTATLTVAWPYSTGATTWQIQLANGAYVGCTLTNGSTAVTFNSALSANAGGTTFQGVPPGTQGINANGNIVIALHDYHTEGAQAQVALQNGACVVGDIVTSDGNNSCQQMFNCASSWTGNIYVTGLQKCGASSVVVDTNRSYNMAALQPIDGILRWPFPAYECIASASINASASPSFLWQQGKYSATPFTSITNIGTGITAISTTGWADANTNYDLECSINDNVAVQGYAYWNSSSQIYLVTRNSSGALAYPSTNSPFSLKMYRKP